MGNWTVKGSVTHISCLVKNTRNIEVYLAMTAMKNIWMPRCFFGKHALLCSPPALVRKRCQNCHSWLCRPWRHSQHWVEM